MSIIVSKVDINAPIEKVFALASKVEDFPEFMPAVKTVEVRERRPDGYALTYWEAIAKVQSINKVVRWEEEENWNADDFTSAFAQTTGDYKKYEGEWKFDEEDGHTRVELKVDYDLGLPLVGALIHKLLDKIMRDNCDSMLKALKMRAEEERG